MRKFNFGERSFTFLLLLSSILHSPVYYSDYGFRLHTMLGTGLLLWTAIKAKLDYAILSLKTL